MFLFLIFKICLWTISVVLDVCMVVDMCSYWVGFNVCDVNKSHGEQFVFVFGFIIVIDDDGGGKWRYKVLK